MMSALAGFLFSLATLFYLPGHLLIKALKGRFPVIDRMVLCFTLGLVVTAQGYHLAGSFGIDNIFITALTFFSIVYLAWISVVWYRNGLSIPKPAFDKNAVWLSLMALFLALLAYITVMTSGKIHPDGMRFYDSNAVDNMAVLSIVQELARPFAHMVPFWSGTPFAGYHIDSFYWIALILRQSGIDALTSYFNLMPLFILPLLLSSVYISARKIFGASAAILATFFALFMGDLSWIFPILSRIFFVPNLAVVSFKGNVLPGLIFTQPNIQAVIMLFCGVYLLKIAEEYDRISVILPGALFLGLIVRYKSFYGIAVMMALVIAALVSLFQKRRSPGLIKTAVLSLAIFTLSSLSAIRSNAGSIFAFTPGYYGALFLNNLKPALGFGPPNSRIEVIAASVFFLIGSLGIKVLSLGAILRDIRRWRSVSPSRIFLISAGISSFLLMNTVTLNTNYAYATSAFHIIFQVVLGLYLGEYFAQFLKEHKGRIGRFILALCVLLGLGSTLFSVAEYVPPHPRYKFLNHDELAAIDFLKNNTAESSVILHKRGESPWYWLRTLSFLWMDPEGWPGRDCFVSGLTGRRVVAECAWYMDSIGFSDDVRNRKKDVAEFFETDERRKAVAVLKKYNVDYVWAQPGQDMRFDYKGILEEVFSKDGIKIYRVTLK